MHAPARRSVDPRALTAALLAALDAEGVEVRTGTRGRARRCSRASGSPACATAAGEELRAAAVVLAAGAWSGQAEWLPEAARPPVRPVKGQILELRSPRRRGAPVERIVASERVYLVPRADGRLIVGATVEERGFDTTVTAGGVHELLREAYRLLPDVAEMELVEAMAGLRPGTPDNLPLVGPGALDGPGPGHRPLPQRHPAGAAGRRAACAERAGEGGGVRIELNGEPLELPDGATLADAVRASSAAEAEARAASRSPLDGEVVPRAEWDSTALAEGSRVEVLAAIQGGAD